MNYRLKDYLGKSIIISILLLLFCGNVHATTGDISAVRILASGYQAEIDISGFVVGGSANFGITGSNNDPSAAKVAFTVTSEGYNDSAVLGTITRTVYGTIAQRKAYPNSSALEESSAGGTLTVRIVLSDYIHNDDTVTVTVASGFYTDSGAGGTGVGSASLSATAATNSSAVDYPMPVANWSCLDRDVVGTSLKISAVAYQAYGRNGKPVRAVKFTATDESLNSVSAIVTSISIDPTQSADAVKFPEYFTTIDISSLTDDQEITVNMEVYPWVGDADSVLKSANTGYTELNWQLRPLKFFKDANLSHGYPVAVVNSVSGNNSTGVVASGVGNIATAIANPYLNIYSAIKAINTYNNANNGRNNTSGGTVYLTEGTHDMAGGATTTTNTGTIKTPLIIRPLPGALKQNVIVTPNATTTNRVVVGTYIKLIDLTLQRSSDQYWVKGAVGYRIDYINCSLTDSRGTGTQIYTDYGFSKAQFLHCQFDDVFSGSNFSRGNNITREYGVTYLNLHVGNVYLSPKAMIWSESTNIANDISGGIVAFNVGASLNKPAMAVFSKIDDYAGLAIVGNLFEFLDTAGQPGISISADGTTSTTRDVIFWQNTIVGQRANMAYNDTGTTNTPHVNWSIKYNLMYYLANKNDNFSLSGNTIGGWPIAFGVGCHGNLVGGAAYDQEFPGIYSIGNIDIDSANYFHVVDDNSGLGGGGGDYHLTADSPALRRVPAGQAVLPIDIDAVLRRDDGTGAAGVYEYPIANRGRGWPGVYWHYLLR